MPTPSVLESLNWPDPSKLGVLQWSLTDDESLTSTVATLQRTNDAVRARVIVQTFEGEQTALFCAVWSTMRGVPNGMVLTNHQLHGEDRPLDPAVAMCTFQDYVNTIGQRPRFTYAGDADVTEQASSVANDVRAPAEAKPPIPRTLRF